MTVYRIYVLDQDGCVSTPPHIIDCDDDQDAIRQAKSYLDGKPIEVWEDAKRVVRLEPDGL